MKPHLATVKAVIPLAQKKKKTDDQPVVIPDEYTLLAADLSLKRPGFCVIDVRREGNSVKFEKVTLMSVDNKTKVKSRGQLLQEIAFHASALLAGAKEPIFLVREQSINNCGGKMAHSSTAARTGISSVVGVMDLLAWHHGKRSWDEIYPVTVKKLLTGNGKAEKQEVAAALSDYLKGVTYKNDDESDAAAVAVAWLISHNQIKQIVQEDKLSE